MHRLRIYPIGSDLQNLQTALVNSVCVLTMSISLCSFSLIARCTFSIMFMSEARAGQVSTRNILSNFQLLCKFGGVFWCTVILEIIGFSRKCFTTIGFKFAFKICIPWDINIILNWYQCSYAVIRFAAENCKQPSALTQEFRQLNFIVQFAADFQEFCNYDIAFKNM